MLKSNTIAIKGNVLNDIGRKESLCNYYPKIDCSWMRDCIPVKIESVNKDSLKILFCCDIIILETKRRHFDVSHVHTAPLHMLFPPPLFHFTLPFFSFLYRHNSGGMQPVALSKVQAVQV